MVHKMNDIQYRWVKWLLLNPYPMEWLKRHIEAPENHERLRTAYMSRQYDNSTKTMLNYLLSRFNMNRDMKWRWSKTREWDKANGTL